MYNRVSVSKRERTREREREPEREREREPERERESERERDTNQYGPVPWNGLINSTLFIYISYVILSLFTIYTHLHLYYSVF